MDVSRSSLEVRFVQLLSVRGLGRPDGRALYAYRFTRGECQVVRDDLRRDHLFGLQNPFGRALFVAFVSEWFSTRPGGRTLGLDPAAQRYRYSLRRGRSERRCVSFGFLGAMALGDGHLLASARFEGSGGYWQIVLPHWSYQHCRW
jgi:hypothetical protein